MSEHAQSFVDNGGGLVRALRFDGRVAGFAALLTAFPGRIAPHPDRDDAVLVTMASGRQVRVGAGNWIVELAGGALAVEPDDHFHIRYRSPEAIAA